jgi:hypothetical protein
MLSYSMLSSSQPSLRRRGSLSKITIQDFATSRIMLRCGRFPCVWISLTGRSLGLKHRTSNCRMHSASDTYFVTNYLIKGTYFTVEEGVATFTPSPTSPVVTSTLLASGPSGPSASIAGTVAQHNSAFSSSSNYLTIILAPFLWLLAL